MAGAVVAHSQGTVSFANYSSGGNYVTVEYNLHPVGGTAANTGIPSADIADSNDWSVQLYGIAGADQPLNTLVPAVLDGTGFFPVITTLGGGGAGPHLGQWLSIEVGDISGTTFANQPATVAVAAWYNAGGTITSYPAAHASDLPSAFSVTGNVTTGGVLSGGGVEPPSQLPQLGNGIINMGVPEPSTVVLGVMGASAFLIRSRRNRWPILY